MISPDKPPDVVNHTCWSEGYDHHDHPKPRDVVGAVVTVLVMSLIVTVHSVFIAAVNTKRYSRHMMCLPRYLLMSLSLGELVKGAFVAPLSLYPSLYHCWPYPPSMCMTQALALPLLHQQSAVTLSLLAIDQYCFILHPLRYGRYVTKTSSFFIILGSWSLSFLFYIILYHLHVAIFVFDNLGSYSCEPYHTEHPQMIIAACAVYFPTTMITMYAYGTVFHLGRTSLHTLVCSSISAPELIGVAAKEQVTEANERQQTLKSGRLLAVLAMFFIILITPWMLRQIIVGCTNYSVPVTLDFLVWILGELTGVFLVTLLWLLSPVLRISTREALYNKICCPNVLIQDHEERIIMNPAFNAGRMVVTTKFSNSSEQSKASRKLQNTDCDGSDTIQKQYSYDSDHRSSDRLYLRSSSPDDVSSSEGLPTPPLPPARSGRLSQSVYGVKPNVANGRPPPFGRGLMTGSCDLEAASEKYWGEILEKAVSSTSLHTLKMQRFDRGYDPCTQHPRRFIS